MAIKFGKPIQMRDDAPQPHATAGLDLPVRMRRNRKAEWSRRMMRENTLTTDDLIWPLFITDSHNKRVPVPSMPGVERLSVDEVVRAAERAMELTIPCIALFPYTDPTLRDETGSEALNDDIRYDSRELEDCRWFSRDEVRAILAGDKSAGVFVPPRTAIAHHLIRAWAESEG